MNAGRISALPNLKSRSGYTAKKDFKALIDSFFKKWRIAISTILSAGVSILTYFHHPSGEMELLESVGLGLLFGLVLYKLLSSVPYAIYSAYFKCPNCNQQLPSIYSAHPTSIEFCHHCNAKLVNLPQV